MTEETENVATEAVTAAEPTPIARIAAAGELVAFAGAQTPANFGSPETELDALLSGAGVYDLGYRARARITGDDRERWLNGMVTNAVKDLAPGRTCYTFLLNAQGRIQGDAEVYALPDALLFATDRDQAPRLSAHLDRFIIMDDVELADEPGVTALGLTGPRAAALLAGLALTPELPEPGALSTSGGLLLVQPRRESFQLWMPAEQAAELWRQIAAAGAIACGIEAVESERILAGRPRYGAEIHERSLAQETGVADALNFNKGCYLGQEIVERVRSRGAVHRSVRVFSLDGPVPPAHTSLFADGVAEPVTELTSIAGVPVSRYPGVFALGTMRNEFAGRRLRYTAGGIEGTAAVLDRPPLTIS